MTERRASNPGGTTDGESRNAVVSHGRRSFLLSAAGAGVAGAAWVGGLGREGEAAPETALAEPADQGRGYRLTGHIQRYYRSTRL